MRIEVGVDVNDVERMVEFWCVALGYKRGSGDGQPYINLVPPDGAGPVVFLQRVPEVKTVKDRLHLDLYVDEPQELVERLTALGASALGECGSDGESWWQVMADPEGNEFCICRDVR